MHKTLATIAMVLGILSLAVGVTFIGLALQKNNYLVTQLRAQKVTLGLTKDQIAKGDLVDTAARSTGCG